MIATTSDYGMTMIMLGRFFLCVVLSAHSYQCPVRAAQVMCGQWSHRCFDWASSFIRNGLLSTLDQTLIRLLVRGHL
jgi:hypothetical protein